jgi:hypothetical protein
MTVALARRLVWEGVVAPEDANAALQAHVEERIAFVRALVRQDPGLVSRLEAELGHLRGGSAPAIVPDRALMQALPAELPGILLAVPVGKDPVTGVVRVLAADPSDTHIAAEMAYHLGGPVEVVSAPLRALFEALDGNRSGNDRRPSNTPAFGMQVFASPSKPPRASLDPTPLQGAALGRLEVRPSDRPIPLVRVSPEAQSPRTVKGVAPQASGAAFASPVVVPPRAGPRITSEPVIQLTRTKSLVPTKEGVAPPSSGPSTVHASPAPAPTSPHSQASELAAAREAPDSAISDFQNAASAEDIVSILVRGLSRVARQVVVLAVRGKVFEGRDTNVANARDAVRALVISGDRPSVVLTAVQAGHYVGPIPQTLVHQELSRILGGPDDDIAVGSVRVSGRAALVYVASGLDTAYLTTRRGEELGEAASRGLQRIVRERKK